MKGTIMKRSHTFWTATLGLACGASLLLAAPAAAHGPGGWIGRGDSRMEQGGLLAEELGVTVEELKAARLRALEKGLGSAVESGRLTPDQADLLLAGAKVRHSVNPDAMLAAALGISAEALQAARDAGKTPRDLGTELGLDPLTMAQNAEAAMNAAIDKAAAEGTITPAQAEALKAAKASMGRGLRHGPRGWGRGGSGPGGAWRPGARAPTVPLNDDL